MEYGLRLEFSVLCKNKKVLILVVVEYGLRHNESILYPLELVLILVVVEYGLRQVEPKFKVGDWVS